MKNKTLILTAILAITCSGIVMAQSPQPAQQNSQATQQGTAGTQAPLQLNGITPPKKIQFPPADPKNFTAQSPTAQEVDAFLKQLWGYDPNRVWQVAGIQKTPAANVSRVTIFVGEQGVSHTPATSVFFVTPDGQHAIAGTDVISFGVDPFGNIRAKLEQQATGPYRGASSKKLMLVEFADLECPHCKEAAGTMTQLAQDFPTARIVFQNFPLPTVHPAAEKAAEYGVCVAKLKGNAAFFQYVQAVFDTQAALVNSADQTLSAAATKAGADASAVATCAALPATKDAVAASVKLGQDVGVDQTPLLYVNGRSIPVAGVPYNTLKQIISFAAQEGSTSASATAQK